MKLVMSQSPTVIFEPALRKTVKKLKTTQQEKVRNKEEYAKNAILCFQEYIQICGFAASNNRRRL